MKRFCLLLLIVFLSCNKPCYVQEDVPTDTTSLIVGGIYARSHLYDQNDPFEDNWYDTIIILDKKNGYVKYSDCKDTSHTLSGTEGYVLRQANIYRLIK